MDLTQCASTPNEKPSLNGGLQQVFEKGPNSLSHLDVITKGDRKVTLGHKIEPDEALLNFDFFFEVMSPVNCYQ